MSKTKNTVKTGISIDSDLLARCDASIPLTNAQSRSEFISDAIEYYIASLNAQGSSKVLTPALESVVGSKITLSEDRISRMIYKLAVCEVISLGKTDIKVSISQTVLHSFSRRLS